MGAPLSRKRLPDDGAPYPDSEPATIGEHFFRRRGYDDPAPPEGHAGGRAQMAFRQKRNFLVKVQISTNLCQGHGRCYDLAPAIFYDDEEGYGQVLGNGVVSPERQDDARRAALNCPEHAITLTGGA
jgi:ferredoxin